MEKLMERFVYTSNRCHTCGAVVYAVEKKKTTNHVYHNRCFCCRVCKRNLTESSLNEEGDDIYCTNCYRKKQRGDCSGLNFQRAAAERAQFVHNRQHPDQPPPKINPRPPIQHDLSRQPSWTLRQLERKFFSHQEPNTKDFTKIDRNYRQLISGSSPYMLRTSFSVPNNLTYMRRNSSLGIDESSPPLQFLPVLSPFPTNYTRPTVKTLKTFELFNDGKLKNEETKSTGSLQFRLNRSSINLTNVTTPPTERKHSLMIDENENYQNRDKTPSRFRFPDSFMTPIRPRTSSVNYSISPRKIK